MSSKELRRKTVLDEVAGGRRKLRSAAEVLQISYRQCRRVYQRYRQQGDQGLIHRNRGRENRIGRLGWSNGVGLWPGLPEAGD